MKTILLLHGALGAAKQLESLSDALKNDFQVHCLEFEGHGQTPSEKPFSIDGFVDNLKDYLDEKNLRNIIVFGYSMGGYVALKLAAQNPEYFEKIITLGTKFHWTTEAAEKEVQYLNPDKIEVKLPAYAAMLDALHVADSWKTVMQKTVDMMLRLGNGEATSDELFKQIEVPCCLCLGDKDQMVSRDETMRIAELISNAEFELLEDTVHPIDRVDVARLAALISRKS
jgi:pimeloyl-ACP methyl ester carboxylesterase